MSESWIRIDEGEPPFDGEYLVTLERTSDGSRFTRTLEWCGYVGNFIGYDPRGLSIIAWKPMPEPYEGDKYDQLQAEIDRRIEQIKALKRERNEIEEDRDRWKRRYESQRERYSETLGMLSQISEILHEDGYFCPAEEDKYDH